MSNCDLRYTGLIPYLRMERGRILVRATQRDVRFAKCPIAWRSLPYNEADEFGDRITYWWTWQGALIPASDWCEDAVPECTRYTWRWYTKLPIPRREGAASLVEEIQSIFLDVQWVIFVWKKTRGSGKCFSSLRSLEKAVDHWSYGEKDPCKEALFLYWKHLRDFLESCTLLSDHGQAEGERLIRGLEEYLGY